MGKVDLCGGLMDWGPDGFQPGIHIKYAAQYYYAFGLIWLRNIFFD